MTIKKFSTYFIMTLLQLFIITAFGLLSLREGFFDVRAIVWGIILALYILLQYNMLRSAFRFMDQFVLLTAQFLFSLGMVMLYRMDPDAAIKQFAIFILSTFIMIAAILVIRKAKQLEKYYIFYMVCALVLLIAPALIGRTIGGAKNWISIGGISIQPSEFAKVLYILVSAFYLNNKTTIREFIPYVLFTGLCVLILVFEKDLGAALLICGTFIIMFLAATGRIFLTGLGCMGIGLGAVICTKLFPHVQNRVNVWRDPWSVYYEGGYQIVQGLMALASGGLFGTGLGLGMPSYIPASTTDYIFAVIGEEFGIIVAIFVILFYVLLIVRGILIAINARNTFDALLVFGCCSMLALQSFIIIGGVIKLIPLTGITLPFVSSGGTSIMNSMLMLGIIEGIAVKNGEIDEEKLDLMEGVIV
ncbi:MAG: FtsW/RodA/SpoVE family cell cycle protein [Christensenellaceae bacterium]|nr:FtsW/RodA/SpoVE family cell cycle protein [Christensenellaceae bacterium]